MYENGLSQGFCAPLYSYFVDVEVERTAKERPKRLGIVMNHLYPKSAFFFFLLRDCLVGIFNTRTKDELVLPQLAVKNARCIQRQIPRERRCV